MRGKSKAGSPEPIEFKGTSLSVVSALLRSTEPEILAETLKRMLGRTPDFFSGDATVIDLSPCEPQPAAVDWERLVKLLESYKLSPVAARVGEALAQSAREAGLAVISDSEAPPRPAPRPVPAPEPEPAAAPAPEAQPAVAAATPAPTVAATAPAAETPVAPITMVVDRPLRSGQQVYARGGDLVVLAMVSAGAEVIADGSIHVYAPLRGRALAGARGNSNARIFTTSFEAELVSVAGVYKTFEQGLPDRLAKKPAQIRLNENAQGERNVLAIEPLQIA